MIQGNDEESKFLDKNPDSEARITTTLGSCRWLFATLAVRAKFWVHLKTPCPYSYIQAVKAGNNGNTLPHNFSLTLADLSQRLVRTLYIWGIEGRKV